VTLLSLRAYIHESNGAPGIDAGSGWVQEARFMLTERRQAAKFRNCSATCGMAISGWAMTCFRWSLFTRLQGTVEINLEKNGKITSRGKTRSMEWSEAEVYREFPVMLLNRGRE